MDEYSGYLWSYFFSHRSDLTVTMTAFVKMFPCTFDKNIVRCIQLHTPLNKMVALKENLRLYMVKYVL
jgi:hypothetical protein